jgi:hypothetical protein
MEKTFKMLDLIIVLVCLFIPFGIFSIFSLCYISSKADKELEQIYKKELIKRNKNPLKKGSYDCFSNRPLEQV